MLQSMGSQSPTWLDWTTTMRFLKVSNDLLARRCIYFYTTGVCLFRKDNAKEIFFRLSNSWKIKQVTTWTKKLTTTTTNYKTILQKTQPWGRETCPLFEVDGMTSTSAFYTWLITYFPSAPLAVSIEELTGRISRMGEKSAKLWTLRYSSRIWVSFAVWWFKHPRNFSFIPVLLWLLGIDHIISN